MNDNLSDEDKRHRTILMSLSGEQRLMMGCTMFDTAKALMEAGIRKEKPQASSVEVRQELFLRFYGHEFDAPTRAKILTAIEPRKCRP